MSSSSSPLSSLDRSLNVQWKGHSPDVSKPLRILLIETAASTYHYALFCGGLPVYNHELLANVISYAQREYGAVEGDADAAASVDGAALRQSRARQRRASRKHL